MSQMLNFFALLAILNYLSNVVHANCKNGFSDSCEANPNPAHRSNPFNFHEDTCNLKWRKCNNEGVQKPPPYVLCTSTHTPSGLLATDWYTFSMQNNNFAADSASYTLHGLWPGSQDGHGPRDQPYGCQNGEEFDEAFLTRFSGLFKYFWPTDPRFHNTPECFILSEWMKHGTCAVIRGADGNAFRLGQEAYYRTVIVLVNEFNLNQELSERLAGGEATISVDCVQCAYLATLGWSGTSVASVPRMSSSCLDQCFACDSSSCAPANLDSTVVADESNAPPRPLSSGFLGTAIGSPMLPRHANSVVALGGSGHTASWLEGGVWRSFLVDRFASSSFELSQVFSGGKLLVSTDGPDSSDCHFFVDIDPAQADQERVVLRSCGADKHAESCLAKQLPAIGELEVGFLACNHSGSPAPVDFRAAMDTPGCGNLLMFRCKDPSSSACGLSSLTHPAADQTAASHGQTRDVGGGRVPLHPYQPGIAGAATPLLGSWRAVEMSEARRVGLGRWNFTADGQATEEFPNYPARGIRRYAVSHLAAGKVFLSSEQGAIRSCLFEFQFHPVVSYALLACSADNAPPPSSLAEGMRSPSSQWAMARCNGCSGDCFFSCGPENNNCGRGPCDPSRHPDAPAKLSKVTKKRAGGSWTPPDWCIPGDPSCWPTKEEIVALEQQLGPNDPRLGLRWVDGHGQPQPAPVPPASPGNLSLYGLGANGLRALYHYESLEDLHRPCFLGLPAAYRAASDVCKAAVRGNQYRDWNPFLVVFALNERHIRQALQFAVAHRLCISVAGTGHEYLSRHSCPTGGLLIRTTLLKERAFLPTWEEDPAAAPHGAFRFGVGATFSEMHNFSAQHDRLISSGWCSTVGITGFHLGGGHGPFAPSLGLGVDNLLEFELLQIAYDARGRPRVHKLVASRRQNPQLFWAMRGGGGGVWGVILSVTIRGHSIPRGGLSRVYMERTGSFCPDHSKFGYEWLRTMWTAFARWNLQLSQKVSTQPGFFIDTSRYNASGLCGVSWTFKFEYFYAGGQDEPEYKVVRDQLRALLQVPSVEETNFRNAYEYLLSLPADKFLLNVNNPLPAPRGPSEQATGSQNSVFVSREAMRTKFAQTMMKVLDICVHSLQVPDFSSPGPNGTRCGFHFLYTSLTGNLGSAQPEGTAIAPAFRSGLMLWNARTLTTRQMQETLYGLGQTSYFSESPYVLPNWPAHYWGEAIYQQLLAVKQAHDPGHHFWCHHCVGDDPNDADGSFPAFPPAPVTPATAPAMSS